MIGVPEEEKRVELKKYSNIEWPKNPQIWQKTDLQIKSGANPKQNKLKSKPNTS